MIYTVVGVDDQSITLWDGSTRDPDHPEQRAGLETLVIGAHTFQVDDRVTINVALYYDAADFDVTAADFDVTEPAPVRCERHNAFHTLGPTCSTA